MTLLAVSRKRWVLGTAAFLTNLEPKVLAPERELQPGTQRPGGPAERLLHIQVQRVVQAGAAHAAVLWL